MKNLQYVMVIVLGEFALCELSRIMWFGSDLMCFWVLVFVIAAAGEERYEIVECLANGTRRKTGLSSQMAGPLKH
jgi:hypothetical protein